MLYDTNYLNMHRKNTSRYETKVSLVVIFGWQGMRVSF